MRVLFISICMQVAFVTAALAQETTSSERLRNAFFSILKRNLTEMMTDPAKRSAMNPTAEQVAQQVGAVMKEAETNYGPALTLPENEAEKLLANGPNDRANLEAVERNAELWKKVQRPKPVLLKSMQEKVAAGKITGGLELELVKRICDFHLRELDLL